MTSLLNRRFLFAAGALVCAFAAWALIIARQSAQGWNDSQAALARANQAAIQIEAQRFRSFRTAEVCISSEHYHRDTPVPPIAFNVLCDAEAYFSDFIERFDGNPQAAGMRADAYANLGRIHCLLGEFAKAERAYRNSVSLHKAADDGSDNTRPALSVAASSNRLAWLLANLDRLPEAEQVAVAAVSHLRRFATDDGRADGATAELAVAYRNLGVIRAVQGRDGTPDLHQGLIACKKLIGRHDLNTVDWDSQLGEGIRNQFYFCIDTNQMLAGLYWQAGLSQAASDACRQSLDLIDLCSRHLADHGNLTQSHQQATRHLTLLNEMSPRDAAPRGATRAASNDRGRAVFPARWEWTQLSSIYGHTINHESLSYTGKLHAEYERHDALIFSWMDGWSTELAAMIAAVHPYIETILLTADDLATEDAVRLLSAHDVPRDRYLIRHVPTRCLWVRDFGPMQLEVGPDQFGLVDAVYSVFGIDGDARPIADWSPRFLGRSLRVPVAPTGLTLHGGALLCNGAGLCLVSTEILRQNIERGYSKPAVTAAIQRLTQADQIVYLEPLQGEPNGHLDWFATFPSANTIVVGDYGQLDPVNDRILDEHAKKLAQLNSPSGPLNVVRIPMPPHGTNSFGGSYTNVVYANGLLIVPSYPQVDRELESRVMDVYRRLLPGWKTVTLDSTRLLEWSGGPHCASLGLYRLPGAFKRVVRAG